MLVYKHEMRFWYAFGDVYMKKKFLFEVTTF